MYDYAIPNLGKALELNPRFYRAAELLGNIYLKKNNRSRALDYFTRSLTVNGAQPDLLCRAGLLHEYYGDYDMAFKCFRDAGRHIPGHVWGNIHLVRYYINKNEQTLAGKHFKISYENGLKKSSKVYSLAEKEEEKNNRAGSIELYEKILKINPAMTDTYEKLFKLYSLEGKYGTAAEVMEKLKYYKPDHERAYIFLGHLYFNRKFPGSRKYYIDLAIKSLLKAKELNPLNTETIDLLLAIYEFIGDDLKASALRDAMKQ